MSKHEISQDGDTADEYRVLIAAERDPFDLPDSAFPEDPGPLVVPDPNSES